MKFIGHLDVMRYFQKAMRRAGIDIAYSEGMSPHMIMSFAQPLGVGLTSDRRVYGCRAAHTIASDEAIRRLNEVGVEGITVTEWRQIPEEKGSKAMTLVAAADYELRFRKGLAPKGDWQSRSLIFTLRSLFPVIKKTKKGEKELDIRPLIYDMYVNAGTVYFRLSAGSEANIKPELVMDAYLASIDVTPEPFAYEIPAQGNCMRISEKTESESSCRSESLGRTLHQNRFKIVYKGILTYEKRKIG